MKATRMQEYAGAAEMIQIGSGMPSVDLVRTGGGVGRAVVEF